MASQSALFLALFNSADCHVYECQSGDYYCTTNMMITTPTVVHTPPSPTREPEHGDVCTSVVVAQKASTICSTSKMTSSTREYVELPWFCKKTKFRFPRGFDSRDVFEHDQDRHNIYIYIGRDLVVVLFPFPPPPCRSSTATRPP